MLAERQETAVLARAIVMKPKYLFCDEPNSGLDPKTAIVIDNLIQEITDEYEIITIINSHDMNSVMEIGEKIIFLKEVPFFHGMTIEQLKILANVCEEKLFEESNIHKTKR